MTGASTSLHRNLARLRVEGSGYAFLYCAADAGGQPVLMVSPQRIDPRQLLRLRKSAQDPAFTRGSVSWTRNKGFHFTAKNTIHPQFTNHLGLVFQRGFPALRRATVTAAEGE